MKQGEKKGQRSARAECGEWRAMEKEIAEYETSLRSTIKKPRKVCCGAFYQFVT